MSEETLKFYYFDLQARGEITRLIFVAAGENYEDIRFSFEQWPEFKSKMLLNQCPVLEFPDGFQLPQSIAIARYVARKNGLAGSNDLESAQIDAIVDTMRDAVEAYYRTVFFEKDEQRKADGLKTFLDETLPKQIENLERMKKSFSKDERFFVGDKLSWADLFIFQSVDVLQQIVPESAEKIGNKFENLFKTINENEKLKSYLESRPKTAF